MNKLQTLKEKYPKIFDNKLFYFECGDGWYNILDILCGRIEAHLENNRTSIESNNKYFAEREMAAVGDWSFIKIAKENEEWHKANPYWIEDQKRQYIGPVPEWRNGVELIPQVVAAQVKEKFGGLRFYYDGGDEYISGLVSMAESMSYRTCEVCGSPGKQRDGSWIKTLCDEHAKERK